MIPKLLKNWNKQDLPSENIIHSISGQLELTRRKKLRFSRLLALVETEYNFNNYFGVLLSTVLAFVGILFKQDWIDQNYDSNQAWLACVVLSGQKIFKTKEQSFFNSLKLLIFIYKSRSIDFVKFFLYLRYIISNYNVSYLWKCTFNARPIRYLVLFHKTSFTKLCNEAFKK